MVTRTGLNNTLQYTASFVYYTYRFRLLNELYMEDNWGGRLYQCGVTSPHNWKETLCGAAGIYLMESLLTNSSCNFLKFH